MWEWAHQWAWAGAGVVMVLVAVCWRIARRHGVRARLEARLSDADPSRRRAAVEVATEQGLRLNAALLVALLDRETDTRVLDALAAGVLRSAWEPADRADLLRLRLWAHEHRGTTPEEPVPNTGSVADAERTVAIAPVVARTTTPLPRRRPQVWTEPATAALPPVMPRRPAHLAPDPAAAPPPPRPTTPQPGPRHRSAAGFGSAPRGAFPLLAEGHR